MLLRKKDICHIFVSKMFHLLKLYGHHIPIIIETFMRFCYNAQSLAGEKRRARRFTTSAGDLKNNY